MILIQQFKALYGYRQALWDMACKQLKAKYVGSVLGISWAVATPLLIMAVISFVFTSVTKVDIPRFPLFALAGIIPWMFFSAALSEATVSIVGNQGILRQFNLPREILPLSAILANFLNFSIGLAVVLPVFIFYKPRIVVVLPLLAPLLFFYTLFTCGFGLISAAANVRYRDVGYLLGVLLMLWFWITPIFYAIDMIPASLRWIITFNPLAAFIISFRDILFYGAIPAWSSWAYVIIGSTALFAGGIAFFGRVETKLLKWL